MGSWAADGEVDTDAVVLDLSRVEFVDTLGLVALAVAAEDAMLNGRHVKLRLPSVAGPRNWLSRMHLRAAMESIGVDCNLPDVNHHASPDRLLELHRFDSSSPDDLADKVYAILSADDPAEAGELYSSVAEAAANVCDHSGADGGWAALRQIGKGTTRSIEFAVADAGVGLRTTLSQSIAVASDSDAMMQAVVRGGEFYRRQWPWSRTG